MKRKPLHYVLDWHGEGDPGFAPGQIMRRLNTQKQVGGYYRVVSVRQVRVRVSRGETSRWSLGVERLAERPADEAVTFTVQDHAPRPKPDRWSPLLEP